jgi:monooxygenase
VTVERVDVVIVGGGLSGIAAAAHLQRECPKKTYAILESRDCLGGTWDLFRYPGVRSDSDMFTLGFSFKPWTGKKALADGETILDYLQDAARELGIDRRIRYRHRVERASWSTQAGGWTVEVSSAAQGSAAIFCCSFLFVCGGYYRYEEGYTPAFPGRENFPGPIVHPQHWPRDLIYARKRVIVIGSGATAVTLVPALAESATHVTMLQRSHSYVIAMPYEDRLTAFFRRHASAGMAFRLIRWRNILFGIYFYGKCRSRPQLIKAWIKAQAQKALGEGFDVNRHFSPRYAPWDQRMCLAPDGDLFKALKSGKAQVVTDEIEGFTREGIKLRSGAELQADVIVTATGLQVLALGGIRFEVDGRPVELARTMTYKGCMFSGVPNLASVVGYTNASWTLKCELVCRYVCRLLNYMDKKGFASSEPCNEDASVKEEPWLSLTSGYVERAADRLPKQGSKSPWRLRQNYVLDTLAIRTGVLDDGVMRFARKGGRRTAA